MDAFEILVVILSVLLGIFLVLAIAATVFFLKLIKNIKQISDKAVSLVDSARSVAQTVKTPAAPTVLAEFIAERVRHAANKHGDKDS